MKVMKKVAFKLLALVSCVLSFAVPIFVFGWYFKQSLSEFTYFDYGAAYVFSILGFILSLFYLWLTPRYFKSWVYKLMLMAIYLLVYAQACDSTIWDHRIEFGTTWEPSRWPMEMFTGLVGPYFYILMLIGAVWHFASHWWLAKARRI